MFFYPRKFWLGFRLVAAVVVIVVVIVVLSGRSVEESQQPQGNLVVLAYLGVVAGVYGVRGVPHLIVGVGVADAELQLAVHQVVRVATLWLTLWSFHSELTKNVSMAVCFSTWMG